MHQNHIKLKEAQSTAKNMEKDYNNLRERLEQEKQKNSRIEQDVQNFQERELNLSKISTLQMKRAWVVSLSFSSFVRFSRPNFHAFRFMEGPGHCPMISKYGPSLSKPVGPVDPSFLVLKISHFNKKNIQITAILRTPDVGCQYSKKTCLKQPLKKKDKTKILIKKMVA